MKTRVIEPNSWSDDLLYETGDLRWFTLSQIKDWYTKKRGIPKTSWKYQYMSADLYQLLDRMVKRSLLLTKKVNGRRFYKHNPKLNIKYRKKVIRW